MASFSKQYLQLSEWDSFPPDFDIDEIFTSLEKGFYRSIICEGFGILALGLDNDGNKLVYLGNLESGEEKWIKYTNFINEFKQKKVKI